MHLPLPLYKYEKSGEGFAADLNGNKPSCGNCLLAKYARAVFFASVAIFVVGN